MILTDDQTEGLVLRDTIAGSEQLEQVKVLFDSGTADALPADLGPLVLRDIALLEDVVGEVCDPRVRRVSSRVQCLDLDALLHDRRVGRGAGVVVAEPHSGRDVS